ncbi:MAG: hypothetical protein COV41_00455 [Candidatus Brennerbacteria bacterium CG11_big_fil_rev_8_21_14_0_20_43_10]|uniref:ParB-like N-terminal domain-containing protein n=3 Tax=Candidatus Brenneribacteriota TaxID=1817902 RepID=A0A2M8C0L0_9BACT|nr:MAG: hypothetical protein AUJ43_00510 [Parcubacteria group bacterium CG1_02_44_31]PIP50162.1 MAG: hypothetical protein COX12_02810 [Candidatus Brennerbacteria bacterium CG23_combo_of_CG06-09_8_20_14_all_44_41]PIR26880.1 MAG: hypothetical protein COV41_00455 [Candidatus Brennerbacteria bacterium CG11_big_fil_rev_8_21_14_0_20_43_10]PIX29098.1 MAG: hypothetical protein COZ64_01010 [Candidatus Brennerbacteria bacterium CG_4_8_14_3_um_filter_43_14]PJA19035.1 MAG: hypothetical protein COX61_02300 
MREPSYHTYNQLHMDSKSVFYLEVSKIQPNPFQPRRGFDQEQLQELANSIQEYGILEPLIVTRVEVPTETGTDVQYQLLAGERRLLAAKLVGLNTVPALIRENVQDQAKLEISVIENIQREDLNAMERARAFAQLADKFGLSQREVAFRVGKSREAVANTMRLLQLPFEAQKALEEHKITEGHARVILSVPRTEHQRMLLGRILSYSMTVRQAEATAKQIMQQGMYQADTMTPAQTQESLHELGREFDPQMQELGTKLEQVLNTKVVLRKHGSKGVIAINFNSPEELGNIIKKILGEQGIEEF